MTRTPTVIKFLITGSWQKTSDHISVWRNQRSSANLRSCYWTSQKEFDGTIERWESRVSSNSETHVEIDTPLTLFSERGDIWMLIPWKRELVKNQSNMVNRTVSELEGCTGWYKLFFGHSFDYICAFRRCLVLMNVGVHVWNASATRLNNCLHWKSNRNWLSALDANRTYLRALRTG